MNITENELREQIKDLKEELGYIQMAQSGNKDLMKQLKEKDLKKNLEIERLNNNNQLLGDDYEKIVSRLRAEREELDKIKKEATISDEENIRLDELCATLTAQRN